MQYKVSKLSNGLKVLTVPMASLESVTVTIWVKTGSRYEDKRTNGISHFLEHMVFKGSQKRPSALAISQVVDSFGGEFNAGTSKDWTNFYIKARSANMDIAMDVLSDMVLNPILKSEEIEREKGTIIQEIAMYDDTPQRKVYDNFEELAFFDNSLAWDIAGDATSVKSITRDDFLAYRDTHYHSDNMLITIAGGVTENEALALAEKYLKGFEVSKTKTTFPKFELTQTKPQINLSNKTKEQCNFILGFMSNGRGYEKRFAQSVMSGILGGGMSSRLFTEVREKRGLAYSVRSTNERYDDIGYFGAYAGVDPKKADEAIKVILDQLYGLADGRYPITTDELSKSKEYIKGHVALSLEDTNSVSDFFGEQELFLPKVLTPEEIYKKIDEVTLEDIYAEAKRLFVPSHLNLALIGPYNDESKFKKLLIS